MRYNYALILKLKHLVARKTLKIARLELTTCYLSNNCYNQFSYIFSLKITKIDRFELSFTILKIDVLTIKLYFHKYRNKNKK